jgi:hypothetical protein
VAIRKSRNVLIHIVFILLPFLMKIIVHMKYIVFPYFCESLFGNVRVCNHTNDKH